MRYDVVNRVDTGSEQAGDRCSLIEKLRSVVAHRRKVVIEFDRATGDERLVGTARGEERPGRRSRPI
jgi:hypothetical protein